jgi:hypothetical protein
MQVGAAAGIEQAEPRPQITRQWPITRRLPAPSRQLAELDRETLYGGGAKGYTDYPALQRQAA